MRASLFARNERHLAGFHLRNAPTNLRNLNLRDIRGNVMGEAFNDPVSQFSAFGGGKLFRFFEDLSHGLSHGVRIQGVRKRGKHGVTPALQTGTLNQRKNR